MTLIDKIRAKTPKRHRDKGQLKSVAIGILGTIITSGVMDSKPMIKSVLILVTGILAQQTYGHAKEVER